MLTRLEVAKMVAIAFALVTMLSISSPGQASDKPEIYIYAGHLLDQPGQTPKGPSTIVIEGQRIREVKKGYVAPEGGDVRVIDLKSKFVLPGLIDAHVHLWGIAGDPKRAQDEQLYRDRFDDFVEAQINARRDLEAGFTTVRDLEADARGIRALRDAIDEGRIPGPTIINAGAQISVTGGHGDLSAGLGEVYADAVRAQTISVCDGPDDCRRAARAQIALGAKVIKIAATGGVLSNVAGGLGRQMTSAEISAVVETAHSFGRKVAAHSHAVDGTIAAANAGVDSIEHGTYLNDEAIRILKKKQIYLVPTMLAPVTALAQARSGQLPSTMVEKAEAVSLVAMESHRKAIAAGVKIAFGTDTGVSTHGQNAQEFALLVEAGMTPMQAIVAATVNAADLLDLSDSEGTISPGKYADIVAVDSNPLQEVRRLEHMNFVMKHGEVIVAHAGTGDQSSSQ